MTLFSASLPTFQPVTGITSILSSFMKSPRATVMPIRDDSEPGEGITHLSAPANPSPPCTSACRASGFSVPPYGTRLQPAVSRSAPIADAGTWLAWSSSRRAAVAGRRSSFAFSVNARVISYPSSARRMTSSDTTFPVSASRNTGFPPLAGSSRMAGLFSSAQRSVGRGAYGCRLASSGSPELVVESLIDRLGGSPDPRSVKEQRELSNRGPHDGVERHASSSARRSNPTPSAERGAPAYKVGGAPPDAAVPTPGMGRTTPLRDRATTTCSNASAANAEICTGRSHASSVTR